MKLFVSALEPSSNIHLQYLLKELKKHIDFDLYGVFSKDIEYGIPLYELEQFSIMGFVDVFKKITFFLNASNEMSKLALECDKILLLDSSSFHIPLAKKIKKANPNKVIMYYILPQIWAWKPWRAKTIEKYFDKLAATLPFEISYYQAKAVFIGHPLLDEITHFRGDSSVESNAESKDSRILESNTKNLITFMPGSRIGEINRIFPIFRELKNILKKEDSNLVFNLVVPKHFKHRKIDEIYNDISDFNIVFDAQLSLYESKFAFICSGTATLECAIIGTPFVLGYKAKKFDALVVKNFLNIEYVGLANILYRKIHPDSLFHYEILQDKLTAKNLLDAYNKSKDDDFISKSLEIRKYLQYGSAKNVACWLLDKN
ncbi:lipid-A-disaccharide synthase [Helicobacter sp. 16-1353]|uniref:lipid-A-disaccharide synthase n=1 Tax=Helicobacter sp. 16-1353 TaxID=2004996 RepID=UPI000DCC4E9F|nr:lipid-A-disaccharide synthase [Helicobacter sp. 16-1353]RAX54877.1 lipid-A-disaccharide synthase [Helicobacter sp. 16-1353]